MLIVTKLSKTCPHAEGTLRHKKWVVLREGIAVAEAHKAEPLCDLTYLRKMQKRGLLEVVESDAPAKPTKKPKAKAEPKPEAPKAKPAKKPAPKAKAKS